MRPLDLLRSCHPLPSAAVTGVTGLLAVGMGLPAVPAILAAGTIGLSQLAIGWANDAIDAGRDRTVGRADKPLAEAGGADRRTVAIAAWTATAATIAACVAWGLPAGGWAFLALLGGQLYNWPLKSTWASIVPYLISFAALPAFVAAAKPGPAGAPGWLLLAGALLGGGAHLVNAVPDLADDEATGVRGLPHRLGARGSLIAASLLLAAATVTVLLGSRPPWWAGIVAALGALALPVIGIWAPPRAAFRAVIVVVAIDVLVLVIADAL